MTTYNPTQTHSPSENSICRENDEISFVDLFMVLVRRKKIVIATMVVVLLSAIAYLLQATPFYESKAVIQVGQVGQVGQIEDLGRLKTRLEIEHPFAIKQIDSVSNFITITAQAHTKKEGKTQLKKIIDQLLQKHRAIYDAEIAGQQKISKLMSRQIDNMRSQIEKLPLLTKDIAKTEPAQAITLVLEKIKLMKNLSELEEKVVNLNLNINKIRSVPTKLILESTIKNNPVKSKAKRIITLSIALGFIIGIFIAFIVEFIVRARQRMAVIEKQR